LAASFLDAGKKDRILEFKHLVVWRLAYFFYLAHQKGARGLARFAKRLLGPFQPNVTIGKEFYTGSLPSGGNVDHSQGAN
jgi:hypothetical protein